MDAFDFGIAGYRPRWMTGLAAVRAACGARLGKLAGQRLTRSGVVWDLDADEWFADAPVFLDFGGEQVELNHQKFDELSITWNTGDPAAPIAWAADAGLQLAWRDDVPPELAALRGQLLRTVELLEWRPADQRDLASGTLAVHFAFERGGLTLYNALDENGLTFEPPDDQWRRHPLT
ncbi:hypothetical protein [Flindersiella endophytica]